MLTIRQSYANLTFAININANNMNILLNQLESELSEAIKSWKLNKNRTTTSRVLQLQVRLQKLKGI